ncbi:hypothetical protein [Terribium terrae]
MSTRDTLDCDTPAMRATSVIVGRPWRFSVPLFCVTALAFDLGP